MQYIHSPKRWPLAVLGEQDGLKPHDSIFLAGSITGAEDWQSVITPMLLPHFNVFNPRRPDFDVTDPSMEEQQIRWEWGALDFCDYVLFWFSHETLAPIALFEYGKMLMLHRMNRKNLVTGVHPDYRRKNDVIIQSSLEGYKMVMDSLESLAEQAITFKRFNDNFIH